MRVSQIDSDLSVTSALHHLDPTTASVAKNCNLGKPQSDEAQGAQPQMLPATCGFKLVPRTIAERYHKKKTLVPCQARSLDRDRLQGWSSHNGATLTMNFLPQDRKCKRNFILLVFVDDCGLICQKSQLLKFKDSLSSNQFKLLKRFARRHARAKFCP